MDQKKASSITMREQLRVPCKYFDTQSGNADPGHIQHHGAACCRMPKFSEQIRSLLLTEAF